jgi:hypothetical protein
MTFSRHQEDDGAGFDLVFLLDDDDLLTQERGEAEQLVPVLAQQRLGHDPHRANAKL